MSVATHRPAPAPRESRAVRSRSGRGFSLLEVTMVIFVIAVVSAVALPRYGRSVARYHATAAAHRVAADLEAAREHAVANSRSATVEFVNRGKTYKLGSGPVAVKTSLAGEPYDAAIVAPDFGGAAGVTFDAYGVPAAGGSLTVRSAGFYCTVAVEALTGRVTVGGPFSTNAAPIVTVPDAFGGIDEAPLREATVEVK